MAFRAFSPELVRNVDDFDVTVVVDGDIAPIGVVVRLEGDVAPKQESRRSGLVDKGFQTVDLDGRWAATFYLNPIVVIW